MSNAYSLTSQEYFEYSRMLEHHHVLFYKVWEVGMPYFTTSIPTACVSKNLNTDKISYAFNPNFWNSLSKKNRLFIICHEALHIILGHLYRMPSRDDNDADIINQAMDLVVNHLLVNKFGFTRTKELETYCWVDKFWPDEDVSTEENFEYYFNKLKATPNENTKRYKLVDIHIPSGMSKDDIDDFIKSIGDSLTNSEKESLRDMLEKYHDKAGKSKPGTMPGTGWKIIDVPTVKKKKWESIIKKWSSKYLSEGYANKEQWARMNRRMASFSYGNMFLPAELDVEDMVLDKISVWFFQDTSGSCVHLVDRFFKAAKSLPPEVFNVKMHCFDTQVYETSLKSKRVEGFGGTSFDIIEEYIQTYIKKNNEPYPNAIFIITDGYGNEVRPKVPSNWYWFLTEDSSDQYVHPKSHKFNLEDFE